MREIENKFIIALKQENFEIANMYLELEPGLLNSKYLNNGNGKYITILHYATIELSKKSLLFLLEKNIDINLTDDELNTALHEASRVGNYEAITILLKKDPNIMLENYNSERSLHLAAKNNYTEIVELLLNFARLNYAIYFQNYIDGKTTEGMSALHYAAENNNDQMLNLLLDNNAETNTVALGGVCPLHISAGNCNQHLIVKKMLEMGASVNIQDYNDKYSPLHKAIWHNCTANAKSLLQKGADKYLIEASNNTALHLASLLGNDKIVKLLLQYGAKADIYANGALPIHLAAESKSTKSVEYLFSVHDINVKSRAIKFSAH